MKLSLICVGKMKAGPERELAGRYLARAAAQARTLGVTAVNVVELSESRAGDAARRKAEEAAAILARAGDAVLFAFDERGAAIDSQTLARRVDHLRERGAQRLYMVIGGADGLDASIRERAELVLSFGAMTLPHQLVRVLALEQTYRIMTIIGGHPYHRS